jgi:hypothetical protein
MRFLVKVNIPVEAGNGAAKAGKLGTTIQAILADLKPEAVYFTDDHGQRTAFLFLEMQDASQIPAIAEPWFLAFNARNHGSAIAGICEASCISRKRSPDL